MVLNLKNKEAADDDEIQTYITSYYSKASN